MIRMSVLPTKKTATWLIMIIHFKWPMKTKQSCLNLYTRGHFSCHWNKSQSYWSQCHWATWCYWFALVKENWSNKLFICKNIFRMSVQCSYYNKFIMPWTSMFNEATFQAILLTSLGQMLKVASLYILVNDKISSLNYSCAGIVEYTPFVSVKSVKNRGVFNAAHKNLHLEEE